VAGIFDEGRALSTKNVISRSIRAEYLKALLWALSSLSNRTCLATRIHDIKRVV